MIVFSLATTVLMTVALSNPVASTGNCNPSCRNEGTCMFDRFCQCKPGFYGKYCQEGGYSNSMCKAIVSPETQITGQSKGGINLFDSNFTFFCQWRIWGESEKIFQLSDFSLHCLRLDGTPYMDKVSITIHDITSNGRMPLIGEFNSSTESSTTFNSTSNAVFVLLRRENVCRHVGVSFNFKKMERSQTPSIVDPPVLLPRCWPLTKFHTVGNQKIEISRLASNLDIFEFCQWMMVIPENAALRYQVDKISFQNDGILSIYAVDFEGGIYLGNLEFYETDSQVVSQEPWKTVEGPRQVMFNFKSFNKPQRQISYQIAMEMPECSANCGSNGRCLFKNACFCTVAGAFGMQCQYISTGTDLERCDTADVKIIASGRAHFNKSGNGNCQVTLMSPASTAISIDNIIVRNIGNNEEITNGIMMVEFVDPTRMTVAIQADLESTTQGSGLSFTSERNSVQISLSWNNAKSASCSFFYTVTDSISKKAKTTKTPINGPPSSNPVEDEITDHFLLNALIMTPDVPPEKAKPAITTDQINCSHYTSNIAVPPTKDNKALPVQAFFQISRFFEINAKQETITVQGTLQTRWNVTTCLPNSSSVVVLEPERVFMADPRKVWKLPLTYENSHNDLGMKKADFVDHFIFVVDPRDFILKFFYSKIGRFSSNCDLEFRKFPFDRQNCSFEFAIKQSSKLVHFSEITLLTPRLFGDANEFEIEYENNHKSIKVSLSATMGFNNSIARFIIVMRRKPYYYFINVVGPCQVLAVIQFGTYLFPAGSSDRPMFTVTILLALTVAQNQVIQGVPEKPDPILITEYIFVLSILTGANLMHGLFLCALANSKRCSNIKINKCCGRKTKLVTLVDIFGFLLIAGFFAAVNLYALDIISHEVKLTSD